ncbi:MAG: aryl-sulfate sulfotransferase [Myxococcota bacterium]
MKPYARLLIPMTVAMTVTIGCDGEDDTSAVEDTGSIDDVDPDEAEDSDGEEADPDEETENDEDLEALVGLTLQLAENPNSTLAAIATVGANLEVPVTIQLWSEGIPVLEMPWADSDDAHTLDVVGMRAETTYQMAAVAIVDGQPVRSAVVEWTAGALPDDLAPITLAQPASDGANRLTLFGPNNTETPYLIGVDRDGEVVWYYDPGDLEDEGNDRNVEQLDDGNVLMLVGQEARIITAGGETVRSMDLSTVSGVTSSAHHDAEVMPNGNWLFLTQETVEMTVPPWEDPVDVKGDILIEVDESGAVVWEWSSFEQLDTDRWPTELSTSMSRGNADWTHANAVFYDETSDRVLVSLRHQDWVIAIDHDTGQIAWALGEDGDFTLDQDGEWFTAQHAATLIDGEVLLYDNGNEKDDPISRAVTYAIDESSWTAEQTWSWSAELYTQNLGDADRLDNGNVLVCAGGRRTDADARIAEVNAAGAVVWEVQVGDEHWVYRAERVDWVQ